MSREEIYPNTRDEQKHITDTALSDYFSFLVCAWIYFPHEVVAQGPTEGELNVERGLGTQLAGDVAPAHSLREEGVVVDGQLRHGHGHRS